jgi:hypothetical protein
MASVTRSLILAVFFAAIIQSQAPPQPPTNTSPAANASPAANTSPASTTPGADPATATFSTEQGLLLVTVKPDKVADYEAVIVALQDAFATSQDEEVKKLAAGWKVYKATDLDAKANAIYVHVLQPAVAAADYRPSLWLDKLLSGAPAELLAKYRDAFAAAPTKLPLVKFADMTEVPAKPANGSPSAPAAAAKPGNGSPDR